MDEDYNEIYFVEQSISNLITISNPSPKRCLHLVVVVGLVRLYDPESNAGGSLTTSRTT
jgi:hypothetical protein